MTRATLTCAALFLLVVPTTLAGSPISVRPFSQQYSQSSAGAGARIDVNRGRVGHGGERSQRGPHVVDTTMPGPRDATLAMTARQSVPQASYPPLSADSPWLARPQPVGPGSFWFQDGAGHVCQYVPSTTAVCFTLTGTGSAAVAPLTPAAIAEHVADRLALTPGALKASPAGAGLTGAPSWFWLDPAPTAEELSLSLGGEQVSVTATPQVSWRFGDGATLDGGPGVAYRPGPAPSAAITHVYQTRCLPGDQGHDPYVLASCNGDGYEVAAVVTWQIRYRASGPVADSGTLPARTTTSTAAYSVSEARAFLVGGSSG